MYFALSFTLWDPQCICKLSAYIPEQLEQEKAIQLPLGVLVYMTSHANVNKGIERSVSCLYNLKKKRLQVHGEFGSCAEYHSHDHSHDIADYFKTVNYVPEGYDLGKL